MALKPPISLPEISADLQALAKPVIVLDDDGQIEWLNAAAEQASKLKGYDAVGRAVGEAFPAQPKANLAQRHDAYFQALIENAQDIIGILDTDGIMRYQSPSIERSLGFKPVELIGRDAFELVDLDDRARVQAEFAALLNDPTIVIETSFHARHKDGSSRVLEAIATNLLNNPIVGGVVVNVRDITTRHHAEEHLRERTAELEQLNKFMVGRELRMIGLKSEIEELRKELEALKKG
jgi:PAS domain S-box-containing protein